MRRLTLGAICIENGQQPQEEAWNHSQTSEVVDFRLNLESQ